MSTTKILLSMTETLLSTTEILLSKVRSEARIDSKWKYLIKVISKDKGSFGNNELNSTSIFVIESVQCLVIADIIFEGQVCDEVFANILKVESDLYSTI